MDRAIWIDLSRIIVTMSKKESEAQKKKKKNKKIEGFFWFLFSFSIHLSLSLSLFFFHYPSSFTFLRMAELSFAWRRPTVFLSRAQKTEKKKENERNRSHKSQTFSFLTHWYLFLEKPWKTNLGNLFNEQERKKRRAKSCKLTFGKKIPKPCPWRRSIYNIANSARGTGVADRRLPGRLCRLLELVVPNTPSIPRFAKSRQKVGP